MYFMNEKFNKNAEVEKFTTMLGIAVRLIVIDPYSTLVYVFFNLLVVTFSPPSFLMGSSDFLKSCSMHCTPIQNCIRMINYQSMASVIFEIQGREIQTTCLYIKVGDFFYQKKGSS